jgi:putative FmdB family regulatory protein
MPIYEYACKACEQDFETLVGANAEGPSATSVTCPHCGSAELARKLSVFAAVAGSQEAAPPCGLQPSAGCGGCCGGPGGSCDF